MGMEMEIQHGVDLYPHNISCFTFGGVDLTDHTEYLFIKHFNTGEGMQELEVKAGINLNQELTTMLQELEKNNHTMIIELHDGIRIQAEMILRNKVLSHFATFLPLFNFRLANGLTIATM